MYDTSCGRICMSKFEILINFLKQIWTRYKFDDIKLMQQSYFVLFNSINKLKRFYSLHGIWWMHWSLQKRLNGTTKVNHCCKSSKSIWFKFFCIHRCSEILTKCEKFHIPSSACSFSSLIVAFIAFFLLVWQRTPYSNVTSVLAVTFPMFLTTLLSSVSS